MAKIKNGFIFGLGSTLFLLLISCGTTMNVFDDTIPPERMAMLEIDPTFTVVTYNGISVDLKTGMGATGFSFPAGRTTLILNLDTGRSFGDIRYLARDINLTYTFAAGETYQIMLAFLNRDGQYQASNIGANTLGLILCQDRKPREALLTIPLRF